MPAFCALAHKQHKQQSCDVECFLMAASGDWRYEVAMAREEIGDTDGGTFFAAFFTQICLWKVMNQLAGLEAFNEVVIWWLSLWQYSQLEGQ